MHCVSSYESSCTLFKFRNFVQSLNCVQLFVTPMDSGTPSCLVLHYLLDFAQTHVHCVSVAIQPSHPLLPCSLLLLPSVFPSIRSFPVSWLFTSGGQNIGASALVLLMNIQG